MKGFLDHAIDPDQRSADWFDSRTGRFTWSQVYRLLGPGKRLMTPEERLELKKTNPKSQAKYIEDETILSDGALTYIKEVIAETLTGVSHSSGGYATQWGEDHEEEGKNYFMEQTGLTINEVGFVPFLTIAGGTCDGDIPEYEAIFELKCPYNSINQIDYFTELTAANFKELYPEYYWQVQGNMLGRKCQKCLFCTYDPRMPEEYKMRYVLVEANPEDQKYLLLKLDLAEQNKNETLEKLKQTDKWKPQKSEK
jgi:hypothetical protein